jgi:uncharacterized protein YndB with AHSA1/START domain
MAASNSSRLGPTGPEFAILRVFDAPRDLVRKAFTERKRPAQWWGPKGFTTTTYKMDVRPGGVWWFVMHGPDGVDYKNKIIYIGVVKPECLVYSHSGDEEGEPGQFHVTVTLTEQGGKTKLTMRMLFGSAEERDKVVKEFGAIEGGTKPWIVSKSIWRRCKSRP